MGQEHGDTAVRIDRLCAGYAGRPVLHEITATLPRDRVTALVGANGSGKSTLLGVLAGVVPVTAGSVRRESDSRPALVVQHTEIPATLPITVADTVAMGRWAVRGPWRPLTRGDRAIVAECLDRLDIAGLARRRLDELSGGQRQRALLARALAQRSDLLLLDEPANGLDEATRATISDVLTALAATGVTVVQATHDRDEARRADHCLLLGEGRLVAAGAGTEVLATPVPAG